jgi:hypothetical protein
MPGMDRIRASVRTRVYIGEHRESNTLNTNTDMKGPTRGFKVCAKGLATRAAGQSARQARFRGTIARASWATSTWSHHTSGSVRQMRGQAGRQGAHTGGERTATEARSCKHAGRG